MAPVTRKRRQRPQVPEEDTIPESIFDALNASDPSQPDSKGQTNQPKTKANEPSVADLMKQLADMQTRQEELERTNMALTTAAPAVVDLPKPPQLNMDNLPDPVSDPKGYGMELAKRTTDYNTQVADFTSKQAAASQTQTGNTQQLWDDFAQSYGDYVDDSEGIEFATQKVIKQAKNRGIDVNRYMFQNSDRFFRDITKAYDERFGKPDGEDSEPAPTRVPRKAQTRRGERLADGDGDADAEAQRTGGIFGGIDGSGGNRTPKAPAAGDMIKDLQDIQRRTGYY